MFRYKLCFDENLTFKNTNIDKTASKILPSNANEYFPIRCKGDGNCLFNAVSKALSGKEDAALELRLRTIKEFIENRKDYDTSFYRNYNSSELNSFEDAVLSTTRNSTYSGLMHMAALSNILKAKIRSVYPGVSHCGINLDAMNMTFGADYSKSITVMWTHMENTTINKAWTPNHFVLLVSADQISQIQEERSPNV